MLPMHAYCWLCQQALYLASHGICCYCLRKLLARAVCCIYCGLPSQHASLPCGRCLKKEPLWQGLIFVNYYREPLVALIHRFKFRRQTSLARALARLILVRWQQAYRAQQVQKPDIILAVPLHHRRIWQRGYNQCDLLARHLAHWLSCPYHADALHRVRATAAQQHLLARQRRRNLHAAFDCQNNYAGQHVVLLDDVVTTGSTVAEIAKLLWRQQIASLQIWCICRTL